MVKAKICPSMLSSDFADLANESARMKACGAHYLHMDVMDGHFVPNLTLGAPIIKCLRKHTDMFLDCHLMVTNPEQWVDDYAKAGADNFTFHIEATKNADDLIDKVKASGMKVGIALKPQTDISTVIPFCSKVDMILIMTVEPGFGGQKIMLSCLNKVAALRKQFPDLDIQVDGGVGVDNIDIVSKSGANVIVSGTGIFGHKDPKEAISIMNDAVNSVSA
ncbi:Ribulose-phosphate 3-epimerase-like protein [Globomyces pollinis-pini]|nr:Ribulose-phosphate 3-epimerase-like protein [Globomyces pollinis-pini]